MNNEAMNPIRNSSEQPTNKRPVSHNNIRRNLAYLIDPQNPSQPARLRTRAALKTVHYVAIFIFWRLLRTIRYAIVGSVIAAVAGTALGPLASGAAFFLAPTGILAGAGVGIMWALFKFRWRRFATTVKEGREDLADARSDERSDAVDEPSSVKRTNSALAISNRQFDPMA
jgi:hypothetical protein